MIRALRLLRRRLLGAVPVLGIVAVGGFLLLEAAPGDAVDAYVAGMGGADAAQIAALRTQFGLDAGPLARLWAYLAALVHGELGWSVGFNRWLASGSATRCC
jgi:peptide/nickel transport system permease protein